jgi:hypothetical protein
MPSPVENAGFVVSPSIASPQTPAVRQAAQRRELPIPRPLRERWQTSRAPHAAALVSTPTTSVVVHPIGLMCERRISISFNMMLSSYTTVSTKT